MNGPLRVWVLEKAWIGNGAEFENDARLNKESVNRFQEWDRMVNQGHHVTTLAKQF